MPLLPSTEALVMFVLRWFHIFFGIMWIGLLYFFNFVNVPFGKTMDGDTKKRVVPQLMGRALFWFRWAAMMTMLLGVAYVGYDWFHVQHAGFFGTKDAPRGLFNTSNGLWISFGGLLGLIMWFNVWFIIWPAQKKLIVWTRDGQKPPEMDALAKGAFRASRFNTYISLAMLFGMAAGGKHFTAPFNSLTAAASLIISVAVIHMIISISNTAGAEFAPPPAPPPVK